MNEELKKELEQLQKALETALTEKQKGEIAAQMKELEEKLAKQNDGSKEIAELTKALGDLKDEFVAYKKEAGKIYINSNKGEKETLLDVVTKNAEAIKSSAQHKNQPAEFEVKADALRSSVSGNQAALDLPGIGQLAHRKLTVYDIFRKVPVPKNANGVVRYVDWDEATKARAAAAVAEGGSFPESTAAWATYTLTLKKVGDSIPTSEEMLYDSEMFAAELANFLNVNVAIKIDTDLVSGSGSGTAINGIKSQIPNYSASAAGITDASIYDLIVKLREAITSSYGSKYDPNVALMNISDINKMKLKKDADNNYVLPPFKDQNGNIIDGVTVIECNSFAANTMALGDSRYGAIYEEPGVQVTTGHDGSDFTNDMVTIKARKRLNLLIRTVDQTGWLEVTDIDAALATLAS